MEVMDSIDYEKIAVQCGIQNTLNPSEIISAIEKLSEEYESDDLAHIYNVCLDKAATPEVIFAVIKLINSLKNPINLSNLIDALIISDKFKSRINDEEMITKIRVNVTKALANTKDSKAVYPLLYCMNNKEENYKIKLSCADALGKIGDRYAVMPLVNIIEDENEHSVYVKESAVSALGMIGDDKAVDSLVSILEMKKGFMNKFTFLRERALEALNKITHKGGEKVMKALRISLTDESPQVRINAIEVLMNSDEPEAENLIRVMLKDENREVVKNAVIALYNILGDDILNEILSDEQMNDTAKLEAAALKTELEDDDIENE